MTLQINYVLGFQLECALKNDKKKKNWFVTIIS